MSKPISKTLQSLIDTIEAQGFVYMSAGDRAKLEAHGYEFEVNPHMVDPEDADFVATRFKVYEDDQTGTNSAPVDNSNESAHNSVIASNNTEAPQQTQTAVSAQPKKEGKKSMFKIATVAIETIPAAARASAKYPFEQLEVGQSFFVPNAASEKGDAAKTLASTISGANKKFSTPIEGQTKIMRGKTVQVREPQRTFEGRRVADGAAWGEEFAGQAGVAVVRTL
ncbi:hypothetical protein Axy19_034 [Achromobacter phage vB_AxyS_19-32_Axy19]|nr:hypothetical protein Axy19_034 [Achromobacter phage vB_AxyS_19-32_Axy19]